MNSGYTSCISALIRLIMTARDHGNELNRMKHPFHLRTTGNRTWVSEVGSSARYQLSRVPGMYLQDDKTKAYKQSLRRNNLAPKDNCTWVAVGTDTLHSIHFSNEGRPKCMPTRGQMLDLLLLTLVSALTFARLRIWSNLS